MTRADRRRALVPEITYPPELPVTEHREQLLEAIGGHQVVVVAGETGSGKTTQLPKLCLELGRGIEGTIAHTQPRRLAARTVAERIAAELNTPLGEAIGYSVRFTDRSSGATLVRLMTDGLLLAQIRRDKLLRRYDTIIVDEAHERSLNVDFLLGYLKRILPRRPDLKLIITSATIDPERFAAHFGGAPVVEVSGRTYPVEVRYRPPADPDTEDPDVDQTEAIGDAVEELLRERPGDVLVFLSGEREIRDTAEALTGRLGSGVEVLPLFARLSSADQQKVFKPHTGRRIVLATNVAETSLTVPGIRYVVDPGTARISRYSARLKVQRLPIERVSQASADQRTGRCGRTEAGVCIRLYTEDDYEARPRFTDPEIQRTSLAAVILQMASIGLGDITDFPFMDPPDRRQVRDGIRLLQELGALGAREELTDVGRRLAQLPLDPRLGRMVLEADRLRCADEVIVIAAALSIQDPRERPADKQQQADQLHARFADEDSDFIAYLNLWRHLREGRRELSGNQFRRRCREEFLHYLRIREWQDLVEQVRSAAKQAGVQLQAPPAEPDEIHQAILSGLLSHLGMKDGASREFNGARGSRFMLFPGSRLARKPPAWVMVAELVETSRLWGRDAARISPQWVEPLAEHLISRSYSEPRWVRERGSVVATERVTLYGLPVVTGRTVNYGRIDPELSRELFIRRALVEGDWETRHDFFRHNRASVEEVRALEDRARRRDILVGDQVLFGFFDERIPRTVVSGAHFDRWWRDEREVHPELLDYPRELLIAEPEALADDGRPAEWRQGPLTLPLSYVFDPGAHHDGVTVHVPLRVLPQLREEGFEWLVPAFREELVTALLRGLPKELRKRLVPVPDTAARVMERLVPEGPLAQALSRAVQAARGVAIPLGAWDLGKLPPHLRMTFRIEDEQGRQVAAGTELGALREAARPRLREELASATSAIERSGLRDWTVGELPKVVALRGTAQAVRAYPALVDEGDSVAVRALESPGAQAAAMRTGTRRLLLLTVPSPVRELQRRLGNSQLALAGAPHGSPGAVLADAVTAAVDALVAEAGGPAWDEAAWKRLRAHVAGRLVAKASEVLAQIVRILGVRREVERGLEAASGPALEPVRRDVQRQLVRLVPPGFATKHGAARLADVERYLTAAARRLERAPNAPGPDIDRMRAIHELEALYDAKLAAWPKGRPLPASLREVRWLLEELRVAQFAQAVGVRGQVSAKRIRRAIADAA
jgi:ATP-dependent helicase HrpA